MASVLVAVGLMGAFSAQPATALTSVWRFQPATPGERHNLWMDARGDSPQYAVLAPGNFGPGTGNFWRLRTVGGTTLEPWFQVYNKANGLCLWSNGIVVSMRNCTDHPKRSGRIDWWQFRSLTNQAGSPPLRQENTDGRLWRLHWYHPRNSDSASGIKGQYPGGDYCLVVPYSQFRVGVRLSVRHCSRAANQQWWVYRS